MTLATSLLQVDSLTVQYGGRKPFTAVRDVSLDIRAGETVGLVGESGSGKSTLGRAILGLVPVAGGSIRFDGAEISGLTKRQRRGLSRDIQVVFQDPYSSLNPVMRVIDILVEPLLVERSRSRRDVEQVVYRLLDQVGLPRHSGERLSSEFSGGQRQRIAIARALALSPRLIVCDEPVSALDMSTQAQIINLLCDIQEQTGVAYLFVAHDLAVVRHISNRVLVMHRGEIVERGDASVIGDRPSHPYTQRLLDAAPVPDPARQRERRRLRLAARPDLGEARP